MSTKEKYEQTKLPMVPIRDVVIFPFMMVPFVIGRESFNSMKKKVFGRRISGYRRSAIKPSRDTTLSRPG